jgi:phage baseplate assembly protein V
MWWAPSEGEQVLVLALGGELDTAFVLPGIFSDDFPAPSVSADALYINSLMARCWSMNLPAVR